MPLPDEIFAGAGAVEDDTAAAAWLAASRSSMSSVSTYGSFGSGSMLGGGGEHVSSGGRSSQGNVATGGGGSGGGGGGFGMGTNTSQYQLQQQHQLKVQLLAGGGVASPLQLPVCSPPRRSSSSSSSASPSSSAAANAISQHTPQLHHGHQQLQDLQDLQDLQHQRLQEQQQFQQLQHRLQHLQHLQQMQKSAMQQMQEAANATAAAARGVTPPAPPVGSPPLSDDAGGAASRKGAPSGPRKAGEGVEEEEQAVVSVEWLPAGGLQLSVTLLAAGFVIGSSGASVREITQHTGKPCTLDSRI